MNIAEVRKVVGRIKASLFKKSNSHSIGSLKSNFRGTGLQFREHQIYAPGDDVRFIDWKILAKTNVPFVKTFEEERNVEIAVVIDAAPTMRMGYKGVSKLQASIEMTCLLYLLAHETGDYIHTLIITDQIKSVEKSSGEPGIARFVKALESSQVIDNNGKVVLEAQNMDILSAETKAIAIKKHLQKNREIVLFSDFNDFIKPEELNKILFRKNTHAFRLRSPLEDATSTPYTLHAENEKGLGSCFISIRQNELQANESSIKKIKKIYVNEPYLENFIKELS